MKTLFWLLVFSCIISLQSCQKKEIMDVAPVIAPSPEAKATNDMQKVFAKILAKAVQADPELRTFLKQEALKQFNGDYDVLYQMVKDKAVNGGPSMHERLSKYDDTKQLIEVEDKLPLLTVFIPTLPSGFSSETWNAQIEVPVVAVCLRADNRVPYYDANGKEEIIEPGLIPGFPTLVIKQNERVITGASNSSSNFYENSKYKFLFTDKNFDNTVPKKLSSNVRDKTHTSNVTLFPGMIDQINIDAFNTNGTNTSLQWQRDYVYYGISSSQNRGPLNRNYWEYIKTMTFSVPALTKMADQSEDPNYNPSVFSPNPNSAPLNAWTDGYF